MAVKHCAIFLVVALAVIVSVNSAATSSQVHERIETGSSLSGAGSDGVPKDDVLPPLPIPQPPPVPVCKPCAGDADCGTLATVTCVVGCCVDTPVT